LGLLPVLPVEPWVDGHGVQVGNPVPQGLQLHGRYDQVLVSVLPLRFECPCCPFGDYGVSRKFTWSWYHLALGRPPADVLSKGALARKPALSQLPLSNLSSHPMFAAVPLPPTIDHQSHAHPNKCDMLLSGRFGQQAFSTSPARYKKRQLEVAAVSH
jgi:hypothetical protein